MAEIDKSKRGWKYKYVVAMAKDVIERYNIKLTLRQLHYRIHEDAKGAGQLEYYPNTNSQYKNLSSMLVKARKQGDIPYDMMEDRTRDVWSNIEPSHYFWKDKVKDKINNVSSAPYIFKNSIVWQKKVTIIVLEKQALEGIFKDVVNSNCILVVCRGYNSLTQLKDFVDLVKADKFDREFHCYFFSDFDPSGVDIQRNFREQAEEMGVEFDSFTRIAITKDQIEELNLTYAPVKSKDSRAKDWKESGVVELDALEPDHVVQLIKGCMKQNYDKKLEQLKAKVAQIQNRRSKKLYAKEILKVAESLLREED